MNFEPINKVLVSLCFEDKPVSVGTLAIRDRKIYFEYDPNFLAQGLEISPLKCPLRPGVKSFNAMLFEGLPGVFNDSLPDGWGRLLLDRQKRAEGIRPEQLTPLDRLAYVGRHGMGALRYEPFYENQSPEENIDLDSLALNSRQILTGAASDIIDHLLALNGSSGGARPKAIIGVTADKQKIIHGSLAKRAYEPWLIKFPNLQDGNDAGAIEYVYALMAKNAGIDMMPVHLFPTKNNPGYFACKRFDIKDNERFHTHTVSGLLHSDFRLPSLDYQDLLTLTSSLTQDTREAEKMYRLAVFNVLAHNQDDHAKNFSFLMNKNGQWILSPAYDLTFSHGIGGEQSTMVIGEGRKISIEHLKALGKSASLNTKKVTDIIDQVQSALDDWKSLAKTYGVHQENITDIYNVIELQRKNCD